MNKLKNFKDELSQFIKIEKSCLKGHPIAPYAKRYDGHERLAAFDLKTNWRNAKLYKICNDNKCKNPNDHILDANYTRLTVPGAEFLQGLSKKEMKKAVKIFDEKLFKHYYQNWHDNKDGFNSPEELSKITNVLQGASQNATEMR